MYVHRSDIVITKTAKILAAFNGKTEVIEEDILKAMELSPSQRMKRKPLEVPKMKKEEL